MSSESVGLALAPVLVILYAVLLRRAYHLIRGGSVDPRSLEYDLTLTRVNLIRAITGMPEEQRLTGRHMRLVGVAYLALAVFGLTCISIELVKLLS